MEWACDGVVCEAGRGTWAFVGALSRHPLQLVVLTLAVLPVLNVGRSVGFPLLYWHEHAATQAKAGAATTLLVASVAFVTYLLELGRSHARQNGLRTLLLGAACSWMAVVALAIAVRAWRHQRAVAGTAGDANGRAGLAPGIRTASDTLRGVQVRPWAFAGGALLAAGVVAAGLRASEWLEVWLATSPWRRPLARVLWIPADADPWPHVLALILALAAVAFWALFARSATLAVAICLFLGLVSATWGFLVFRIENPTLIVLIFGAVLAIAGTRRYRLRLRSLRPLYDSPVAYPPPEPPAGLLDFLGRAGAGSRRDRPGEPRPLVVVCTSGGGIRAAAWTAAILERLDRLDGFRRAARLVTGASGGMVGATYWVGSLYAGGGTTPGGTTVLATVARDSLTALARGLVFRDLPFAFLPCVNEQNRGQALEDAWHAHAPSWLDVRFADLREGECDGLWPSLVFTPMLLEDGRRLVISNLDLAPVTTNEVRWLDPAGHESPVASLAAFHFEQLFPGKLANLPVGTAARLSAAFPYSNPAIVLPTQARRRVGDAGYFDNYGLQLACGWLRECLDQERAWLEQSVSGILLIQIRDSVSELSLAPGRETGSRVGKAEAPLAALGRGFEWLLGPVEGVLNARTAAMIFRNDADLETVTRLYDEAIAPGFLRTAIFELGGEVSFSWYLTRTEEHTVAAQADSIELAAVAAWLRDPTAHPAGGAGTPGG